MKLQTLLIVPVFLIGPAFQHSLNAQEKDAKEAAMMQAWEAYMTPGPMHELLAEDAGEWEAEITHWTDPQAPPAKAKGTETCKMIMGGRYLQISFSGEFMGQPYNGMGLMGYDNAKKEFISTWVDDMGSGFMITRGSAPEETGKPLKMKGTMVDPMTGKDMKIREVITRIDENNRTMEMYMTHEGQEMKTMEIKYTRK